MHVNTLNERTRQEANFRETANRLTALLIAVYAMPLEARTPILEKYYHNLERIKAERLAKDLGNEVCSTCNGDGYVDINGDAGELGWDKIGEKPCPVCFPPYESFIQD